MAQETFGQVWNKLLLYAPGTPPPLAQQFVKAAYAKALGSHLWSDLLADGEKVIATAYTTGTASVTNGGTTMTLDGATADGAWVTRQIKITDAHNQPYYTITATATTTGGAVVTVDRSYQGATDTSSGFSIGEYYVEFPSDLDALLAVRDLTQKWRLRGQVHSQLFFDAISPDRNETGGTYTFVGAPPRVESGVSYPRFEFYPVISDGTHIVYRYVKNHELTTNSTRLIPGISAQGVLYGALAELALWPGTAARPNPYFSMDMHKTYTKLFEDEIHDSEMTDLERVQTMIVDEDTNTGIPVDANWRQTHGIPL